MASHEMSNFQKSGLMRKWCSRTSVCPSVRSPFTLLEISPDYPIEELFPPVCARIVGGSRKVAPSVDRVCWPVAQMNSRRGQYFRIERAGFSVFNRSVFPRFLFGLEVPLDCLIRKCFNHSRVLFRIFYTPCEGAINAYACCS